MSDTEDTPRREPTQGLRVAVIDNDRDEFCLQGIWSSHEQAKVDATYINWLIETDEKRRAHIAKQSAGSQDLLIDMGDMTRVDLDGIRLDEAYESMTEDFIQTCNNIIIQGIPPINALFSMSQAFAIVMGYALRANMNFEVAKALITQVMKSATASEQMVRIITKQ
jgi:hypothetical protein